MEKNRIGSEQLVDELIEISVKGLLQLFDWQDKSFFFRARRNGSGILAEGHSQRYSIIALLGLYRYEQSYGKSPVDLHGLTNKLVNDVSRFTSIGDIGLLLWLCSLVSGTELPQAVKEALRARDSLSYCKDGREEKTTELSWLLTGLSYARMLSNDFNVLDDLSCRIYEIIKKNYGGKGIFRHMGNQSLQGKLRGRIGCFADQVYPIYALTKFYQAYGVKEALDIAGECGVTLCGLQGSRGQWWWHYDSKTGRVLGRYPVYSVHQDGMAPMALFALGRAIRHDFTKYIFRGLEWLRGDNELGISLQDKERNVIWRNIYHNSYFRYYDVVTSMLKLNEQVREAKLLKVLYECWSYHLGWVLYAFAQKMD